MSSEFEEMPAQLEVEAASPPNTPPILVRFFNRPEPAGIVDGYQKHRDVIYCEKSIVGSRLSVQCQPATDKDKERFPKTWAMFKDVTARPREGMPIEEWPQITRSEAMNMRVMNVHTVEQLAALSVENPPQGFGQGSREIIARAKAFIAAAKDNAVNAQMASENQHLKDEIADLRAQIGELAKHMGENKRGPGRPRKVEVAA